MIDPFTIAALAAAGTAAYKGIKGYADKNQQRKDAKREAVKQLYANMAGPYANMIPGQLPEGGSAFQDIAMPVGGAIIGTLGQDFKEDENPWKVAARGVSSGLGG